MKVILFIGTKIGYKGLKTLIDLGAEIEGVFVDREHDHEIEKYFEKSIALCQKNAIDVFENVSKLEMSNQLKNRKYAYIFCFGFRRMIENAILSQAKYGALSTHFAMLPEYRGFAPVNWAIINGESECGVSLFHMEDEMDSGDIVAQKRVVIGPNDYVKDVMETCINTFIEVLTEAWPKLLAQKACRTKQEHARATYTCARNPEDGWIDWNHKTKTIYDLIRGSSEPFPGAYTYLNGKKLVVWTAKPYETGRYIGRIPGKVIQQHKNQGVVVLTGDGALLLETVEYENEKKTADCVIKSVRVTLGR